MVPQDTRLKYGLTNPGKLGIYPKRFKIKSQVLAVDTLKTDKEEFIYLRQIRHKLKIGWKSFYTTTLWNTSESKKEHIRKPKIHKVYGSTELEKFHFIVITENAHIDKQTGKVRTTFTHTRILN